MKNIPVRQFMQRRPAAVPEGMLLQQLVTELREGGFRALPVVTEEGKVAGVVSETDLFLKEHRLPFSTEKMPSLLGKLISKEQIDEVERRRKMTVGEVMHPGAVTVDEETTLEDLAILMCERRLSMVPVVRDDLLVGVARRSDVLAVIYSEQS